MSIGIVPFGSGHVNFGPYIAQDGDLRRMKHARNKGERRHTGKGERGTPEMKGGETLSAEGRPREATPSDPCSRVL